MKVHPPLDGRFYRTKAKPITSAKRLHIGSERLIVVALSLWLAGCNNQQPAAHGPPPPEVTVSKPEQKEVVNWNEFTGRTTAVKLVTVTPRVSGYIVDIPFKEGDLVHKGDLLFQIDPRPYQHAYEQAVGQLQQAQANQQLQDATFGRQQRLRETEVIAKEDYDTALSNKNQQFQAELAEWTTPPRSSRTRSWPQTPFIDHHRKTSCLPGTCWRLSLCVTLPPRERRPRNNPPRAA